ncbi:FAD-binding oxidoreductase [Saccharomonospora sp. NPDC046836]|uniref:FAD-binding oxidoreductase n=1 Tax=Saccharomonospora sp. NPDC046836 TaxID=3156921 RepID=UPI00340C3A24
MTDSIDHRLRGAWTPEGADAVALAPAALRWLVQRIGRLAPGAPLAPDSAIAVAPSGLPAAALAQLTEVVGAGQVLRSSEERLARSGGLSYLDLVRRRYPAAGIAVPDAVVLPADPDQVQRVLDVCVAHDIGVVPFGGGTSVVGGVSAVRGDKDCVLVLDLERLNRLVSVDPVSRIAVLQAGMRAPDAERQLSLHGFTLGHVPQSFERATIGGFAATRSAGQASSGYGRFEDMVTGLRLATPRGEWRLGVAPASAAGPDLRQLAIGSEGTLGVITEVAVRVRPLPETERFEAFAIDGWERGNALVRHLAQRGLLADVTRLSDVDETASSLALSAGWGTALLRRYLAVRGIAEPCLLILGWYGESLRRRREAVRSLRAAGAVGLGQAPGRAWLRHRFAGPRQRDALLALGVCVETLETATRWANLDALYAKARAALRDALGDPLVFCHISHAYETGASLYFTVLTARDENDPIGQWERAKHAASAAIADESLGTISHHHAVGTEHAPYLEAEIGAVGVAALAAVKQAVDPTGILNPGKLLP